MIIKRKLYTRQETKAMKEMYQALKKGNIGRGLSAKKFVKARHVSNETIDALTGKGQVVDYAKNSQAINDIGLPETAKAYKRMMEKYTNPELHERFDRIQAASSNNRLRVVRQRKKELSDELVDSLSPEGKEIKGTYFGSSKYKNDISEEYKNTLKELEDIKKFRSGKSYKINKEDVNPRSKKYMDERVDLANKYEQAYYLSGKSGSKNSDPEQAQKIIKDLKKKGVKITTDSNETTHYNIESNSLNFNNKYDLKDPSTILHENGHRLSISKKETRPEYYKYYVGLDKSKNTSHNLRGSIMNRVGDLSTLTEEANASYHEGVRNKGYGTTKMRLKAGIGNLNNYYRTYETDRAIKQLADNYRRNLGKYRNK